MPFLVERLLKLQLDSLSFIDVVFPVRLVARDDLTPLNSCASITHKGKLIESMSRLYTDTVGKAREGITAFLSFKSNFIINTVHWTLQRYLSRGLLNFTMQSCNLCDDEIQIRGTKSYNIASIYFLVRITFVREFSSLYCKSHNLSVMFISPLTSVQMKL